MENGKWTWIVIVGGSGGDGAVVWSTWKNRLLPDQNWLSLFEGLIRLWFIDVNDTITICDFKSL